MVTEQPELSFAALLRQLRAEAKLTQEELAAAAGVSPRSVSNLERGINRTAHKDTAVLLAGALGLTGPAEELFVAAARGNVPPAQVLAAAEGAGRRSGDRFPVPRAERVRGAGRGVVFRPGSGRHRAAGPDVAAAGGGGAAGGVRGVGRGEVVVAAGGGAAADRGGWAGGRAGGGVVAVCVVHPDPGAAG